jgi:pyrroline-5-carboxylate reductase
MSGLEKSYKENTIAIIGAGTIGSAIVKSLLKEGFKKIIATRRNIEKLKDLEKMGVEVTSNNKLAASKADIIILSVKPHDIINVLKEIEREIENKLVISVAAAIPLSLLKKAAPKSRFIRAMPNIAVLVQESFTAYCLEKDVNEEDIKKAEIIFKAMGKYARVEEKFMNAITALSGSAPAYLAVVLEALSYAGLKVGLPRDLSLFSSAQAFIGLGKLVLETGKHPAELKDMVVTPAGVTIEAIYEVENSSVRTAIMKAVEAATNKSEIIVKKMMESSET